MMRLLLTAVVLATPLRATATTRRHQRRTRPGRSGGRRGRNRVIDARVGRWHILTAERHQTIGNKTMWSMCNAAGTPGKHFRDCEKGCNSLGGTLVSVEDRAQQSSCGTSSARTSICSSAPTSAPTSRRIRAGAGRARRAPITRSRPGAAATRRTWVRICVKPSRQRHRKILRRHRYVQDEPVRLHQLRAASAGSTRLASCRAATAASIARRGASASITELGGVPSAHCHAHRKELDNTDFCRPIDIFWITVLVTICGGTLLTFAHSIMKARRRAKQLERMRVRPAALAEVTAVSSMPVGVAQSADGRWRCRSSRRWPCRARITAHVTNWLLCDN